MTHLQHQQLTLAANAGAATASITETRADAIELTARRSAVEEPTTGAILGRARSDVELAITLDGTTAANTTSAFAAAVTAAGVTVILSCTTLAIASSRSDAIIIRVASTDAASAVVTLAADDKRESKATLCATIAGKLNIESNTAVTLLM